MSRLHLHVSVPNLEQAVSYYSQLFGSEPTILKPDYAKWSLLDPAMNFAISPSTDATGINHVGIEVASEAELAKVTARLEEANAPHLAEPNATCCYSRSEKTWSTDPAGLIWETFYTHGESAVYGGFGPAKGAAGAEPSRANAGMDDASTPIESVPDGCCGGRASSGCAISG